MTRAHAELLAVVATGAVHLVFEEVLGQKAAFIALATVAWTAYLVWSVRRERGVVDEWGLGRRGLRETVPAAGLVLVVGAIALAAASVALGHFRLHWHMLPLLALYPVWGVVQQFVVQGLLARNLDASGAHPAVTTLATAALFGLVHWPDRFLMAATFALALLFTPIWLRHRNVWPLGIAHGWLGVLAYYWLLGRDPWTELFG